ncbi:MAG: hypothetical protein ACK52I_29265 [Pseudomonadota bacterium]
MGTSTHVANVLIPAETPRQKAAVAWAKSNIDGLPCRFDADDIEIDDTPGVSDTDNGVWVSAWVWVPNAKIEGNE